jgi:uncharacterized coiled-coil protein SlyX
MTTKKFMKKVGTKLKFEVPKPTGLRAEIAELRQERANDSKKLAELEKKVKRLEEQRVEDAEQDRSRP